MKGRFTGRVVVAVLGMLAVLCALLSEFLLPGFEGRPPEPVFDRKPISVWFLEGRHPTYDRERFKLLMDTEGAKAVPWLLWTIQHGDRKKTSAFGKFVDRFFLDRDPNYDERGKSMDTLRSITAEQLRKANRQDFEGLKKLILDPEFGAGSAYVLARLGGASYDWILQAARTGPDLARWNAVWAFNAGFESGTEEEQMRTIEALLAALEDPDAKVRASAVTCYHKLRRHPLMQANYERVEAVLKKLLSDPNQKVRQAADMALYNPAEYVQ